MACKTAGDQQHFSPRATECYYLGRQYCHLGMEKQYFSHSYCLRRGVVVEAWKNKQRLAVAHNDFLTVYMNQQSALGLLLSNCFTLFSPLIQRFYSSTSISGVLPF